mmetsp:Transcript_3960/g.10074  ORF Transcript_3960/g.10074 Transcript_3960/m.10074 type:complete len:222 (+) Transcript_3960:485-1150(+)
MASTSDGSSLLSSGLRALKPAHSRVLATFLAFSSSDLLTRSFVLPNLPGAPKPPPPPPPLLPPGEDTPPPVAPSASSSSSPRQSAVSPPRLSRPSIRLSTPLMRASSADSTACISSTDAASHLGKCAVRSEATVCGCPSAGWKRPSCTCSMASLSRNAALSLASNLSARSESHANSARASPRVCSRARSAASRKPRSTSNSAGVSRSSGGFARFSARSTSN